MLPNIFFFKKLLEYIINNRLNRPIIWLLNNSKGFIFQSDISLKMHKKFLNFKKKNYTIIYNGVNLQQFKPRKKFDNKKSIIISASVYRPAKRLHEAIKLINYLSNIYPKINLHILGELDNVSKEIIKNYNLSNCIFYGRINYLKLPSYYNDCDIQIHPAIFDPCPNVVVEGLASGLPVITPAQSGAYELIGKNLDWSINEHIKLEYKELYCIKSLPEIPLEKYAKKIINVFENLNYHKEKARYIAEKNLDIKIVKKKYLEFINRF
jgi:glycosyltransferase involved in cell wall biosynthesis